MDKIKYDKNNVQKVIGSGTEGNVFLYIDDKGRKTALKIFKNKYTLEIKEVPVPEKTILNKEKKIELLSKQDCLKDDIHLLDLVYDNDKFIGYTSLYEPYESFGVYRYSKPKIKLELLKKLKEKVIELNKNGIFIGDYNSSNFAVENGNVRLFDIDNYKIGDFDFDIPTSYINHFKNHCQLSEYLDNYCFNLYSVAYYGCIIDSFVIQYIQNQGLPKKMNSNINRGLKLQLLFPGNDYKPEFLIDNMKKGLFK